MKIPHFSRVSDFASTALLVDSFFQGAGASLLLNVQRSVGLQLDLLGGFRYLNLQENHHRCRRIVPLRVRRRVSDVRPFRPPIILRWTVGTRATGETTTCRPRKSGHWRNAGIGTRQWPTFHQRLHRFGPVVGYPGGYFQTDEYRQPDPCRFAVVPEANEPRHSIESLGDVYRRIRFCMPTQSPVRRSD